MSSPHITQIELRFYNKHNYPEYEHNCSEIEQREVLRWAKLVKHPYIDANARLNLFGTKLAHISCEVENLFSPNGMPTHS